MSKGSGRIERCIGELFAATKDHALSVGELAAHAFGLPEGVTPDRKQRLSATRAAHRLLRRAEAAIEAVEVAFSQAVSETAASLGREPGGRGRAQDWFIHAGRHRVGMDEAFHDALLKASGWPAYQQAFDVLSRERKRFGGVLIEDGGWRSTETKDRRLWFHPADYPVRVWAVAICPEGVAWADTDIIGVDNTYVRVRYLGEPARLDRSKLAQGWTIYRNVFFTAGRSGYAARSFDEMWRQRYWHPGTALPPIMAMPLQDAIKLLGVPVDFTREDIIKAFRRKAMQCHPDHGGTAEQFRELVKARDRLLAALGTKAAAPNMPEFAPKGAKLRYGTWNPNRGSARIGQTRRLAR
jgi:hypothetical protein